MKGSWEADRDPLLGLRDGHPELYEAFVRAETGTFLAFFARLGASAEEAEDLTQDLFLKLFKSASTYDPQSHFAAFAMRIAKNAWIDRHRRRGTRPQVASLSAVAPPAQDSDGPGGPGEPEGPALGERLAAPPSDPGRALAVREDLARFRVAFAALPLRQREAFELAVLQELPYAEIAALLAIPVGTVKSRVFHALRRLRELMEEEA